MGFGTKLAIFGRRLKGASLRRMNQNIGAIHQETGKNRALLLCDMIWCTLRYGVGYLDYHVFGFAQNRGANRKTFMTMNHNVSLARMVNDATYYPLLNDKFQFLQRYGAAAGWTCGRRILRRWPGFVRTAVWSLPSPMPNSGAKAWSGWSPGRTQILLRSTGG